MTNETNIATRKSSKRTIFAGSAALAAIAFAAVAMTGCGPSDSGSNATSTTGGTTAKGTGESVALNGAGSSFVYPAMSAWIFQYQKDNPGITINYQSVGSGAGIAQYKAGTVDFGASDAPLSDKELADMPSPTVQIPVVSGCEVLAYNLPDVKEGLKLSSDVLADMYLGKITKWNDPKIASQNPELKLPDTAITIAHRSDGSGTTYVFTDYLSAVSPEWKSGPGMGKTVNWPVGIGGKGNDGVAGLIKQTPGCIGYVELAYAVQAKLTYGPLKNKSGEYVMPSVESTSASANAAADALKKDIRVSIVDGASKDAYPICGMTYVLMSKAPKDKAKAKATLDFIEWALGPGQKMSAGLQYGALPDSVVELNKTALSEVDVASK
ncbi:MAG: phosphate ABC transporter substrate-binding protein PstS [Armatimonadetes bacterium]|nr:phosphate ABC transporter substrate-binding protein PstS [Armatimonadota bacterium]